MAKVRETGGGYPQSPDQTNAPAPPSPWQTAGGTSVDASAPACPGTGRGGSARHRDAFEFSGLASSPDRAHSPIVLRKRDHSTVGTRRRDRRGTALPPVGHSHIQRIRYYTETTAGSRRSGTGSTQAALAAQWVSAPLLRCRETQPVRLALAGGP